MKKITLILAVLGAAFAISCKEEDYQAGIEAEITSFNEYYRSVLEDETLTDEQKEEAVDSVYNLTQQKLCAIASRAIEKHSNDSIAVQMLQMMATYELTDKEGLLNIIETLGPDAATDPSVEKIREECTMEPKAPEGSAFIDFAGTSPDGKSVKLSQYAGKGKYCLVDFWASWCGPCRREIPNIIAVYEKYAKKGLEVVSVAVWDKKEDALGAAKEHGIKWNQIVDVDASVTEQYGIKGIPHIMLIAPDGTILKRDLRGTHIEKAVKEVL